MENKDTSCGHVALVTGGARGIGREITNILAKKGYTVIIAYHESAAAAMEIIEKLQSRGQNCGAFCVDLSNYEQVEKMYERCRKCYGVVDTLINNAGVSHFGLVTEDTPED